MRAAEEPTSDFRFRYARYCVRWIAGLGLPLLLLMLWSPSIAQSPAPLLTMFLYFGLPIGAGMALLASLGFMLGGLWARLKESSAEKARVLDRIKFAVAATLLLPVCAGCVYFSVAGLLRLEVQAFSRNEHHVIAWATQPGWFIVNVLIWGGLGTVGFVKVIRKLRTVYAA